MSGEDELRKSQRSGDLFGQGCGVLRHAASQGSYRHIRYPPDGALGDWVQHFWVESWDMRGFAPQAREVLPHPCVHLVLGPGRSRVYGVQLKRFLRELRGCDRILGIKFRPGAFYPFLQRPVRTLADSAVAAAELFVGTTAAERDFATCEDDLALVRVASRLVLANLPARDPTVETAGSLVELIAADRSVTRVEHLVARSGLSVRTLQRLFQRYVGASARWVITRYRLYEALGRVSSGDHAGFAALALDLGYYDQAHFINDFRNLVGRSPSAYLRSPNGA